MKIEKIWNQGDQSNHSILIMNFHISNSYRSPEEFGKTFKKENPNVKAISALESRLSYSHFINEISRKAQTIRAKKKNLKGQNLRNFLCKKEGIDESESEHGSDLAGVGKITSNSGEPTEAPGCQREYESLTAVNTGVLHPDQFYEFWVELGNTSATKQIKNPFGANIPRMFQRFALRRPARWYDRETTLEDGLCWEKRAQRAKRAKTRDISARYTNTSKVSMCPSRVAIARNSVFSGSEQSRSPTDTTALQPVALVTNGRLGSCSRSVLRTRVMLDARLRIGSWNIGTLTGKSIELVKNLKKRKINIAYVQDTIWVGPKAKGVDGYKL
ncbi:hypothetical protein RND71_036832 [Anisodus tanguticus]|uniref:Craniofacial development protein 2-like n=1 Tax=Anisodus tanguticus TaxID=243964 RepID=A0AAE1R266_9SOLA|nr:hypothetical protein RND71_036832 [Anisodus tanguticus]